MVFNLIAEPTIWVKLQYRYDDGKSPTATDPPAFPTGTVLGHKLPYGRLNFY